MGMVKNMHCKRSRPMCKHLIYNAHICGADNVLFLPSYGVNSHQEQFHVICRFVGAIHSGTRVADSCKAPRFVQCK